MAGLCNWCSEPHGRSVGEVNRAAKIGAPLYCNRECAGMGRRTFRSKAEKVAAKKVYDAAYRIKNEATLKPKRHAYFKRTYDPKKAAIERKKTMARHVEYCRSPEYKAYKTEYDRQRRAGEYGPFAEAFLLAVNLNREIKSRASNYEIRLQNQTLSKTQNRRREEGRPDRSRRYSETQG